MFCAFVARDYWRAATGTWTPQCYNISFSGLEGVAGGKEKENRAAALALL
jgi:hypothetical protein